MIIVEGRDEGTSPSMWVVEVIDGEEYVKIRIDDTENPAFWAHIHIPKSMLKEILDI